MKQAIMEPHGFRQLLEQRLDEFKRHCLEKYDRGAKEHGGRWPDDIEKEIRDEIADFVNYTIMRDFLRENQLIS
jgi:hypothetical protein